MVNLKSAKRDNQQVTQVTIVRPGFNHQQLLWLILVSVLIHGLGLLLFARYQRIQSVEPEKTDLKPIEFTVVPEKSPEAAKDKIGDALPPDPEPAALEPKIAAPPTPPSPEPSPAPAPAPAPQEIPEPPDLTPTAKDQTPILSGSDNAAIPKPETSPSPQPQNDSVATSLPSKSPPIPEPKIQPKKPANPDGVSTSAGDLLGGDFAKTLASGGDAFFSPEALEYKSVLNPDQLAALKGIDLSQYLAAMEGKVKPNWNPAFRQDERTTVLTFNIEKSGQVTGLQLSQSSGSDEVDRDALEAVQNSVPFAPLPADFPLKALEITFSFNIHIY
jgi:periplasmic protein TonB